MNVRQIFSKGYKQHEFPLPEGPRVVTHQRRAFFICSSWAAEAKMTKTNSRNEKNVELGVLGSGGCVCVARENAVDGELLCSLKRAELIQELGLTPLQAAKVFQRLKR